MAKVEKIEQKTFWRVWIGASVEEFDNIYDATVYAALHDLVRTKFLEGRSEDDEDMRALVDFIFRNRSELVDIIKGTASWPTKSQ